MGGSAPSEGRRIDEPPGWLVTGRERVVEVLRSPEVFTVDDPRFSTGRVLGPNMLSLDGIEHTRHRAPFAGAFKIMGDRHAVVARMATTSARLVSEIRSAGRADLRRDVAAPLAADVMLATLGLDGIDATQLLHWYTAIVDSVTQTSLGGEPHAEGAAAMDALGRAVRESTPDSPVLTAAMASMSPDEVVSNVAVMLFGGLETSEAMTANALAHVLADEALCGQLRADTALIATAVDESVRLEPAAARLDRYATRDYRLGELPIVAGDHVMLSIRDANRDPTVFAQPETFRLDRTTAGKNLAFAQGPHACLATHVAKAETAAAIAAVLALPAVRLTEPVVIEGVVFRKAGAVNAAWDSAG